MRVIMISLVGFSIGLYALCDMISIKAKLSNKVSYSTGLDFPYPKDCGQKRALKCRLG